MTRASLLLCSLVLAAASAFAGGPLNVAGVSWFNPGISGQPIIWTNGQISYYTDQGDLSPLLPKASADAFVADAWSRWTSLPTAAINATSAGLLDEDVSAANVISNGSTVTLPADIQPTSAKPVAIVYDYDGSVVSALLGTGAGDAGLCNTNSILGGIDQFTPDGHIAHALVVINGQCALNSTDLPVLKYKLVRMFGRVLGLDWSQLNDNVVTGTPRPTADDYSGFPVMDPIPAICTVWACPSTAATPRADDRAALARLYPVTASNIGSFTGKQITATATGRVQGSVRFPAWRGQLGQGMQGVNVVARQIDPVSHAPSHKISASCVSGFLFRGNAGNEITGFADVNGNRYDMFGSADPTFEGFYDLAGLELPTGYSTVQYQLSIEPLNPLYFDSASVGPYKEGVIAPPGSAQPITVLVTAGGDTAQDIVVTTPALDAYDRWEPNSFASPSPIPGSGEWQASLSGYGDIDYYTLRAHANTRFSFDVIALDENGTPTASKAQPALAIWDSFDTEDAPSVAQWALNTANTGETKIVADILDDGEYKMGIADARGDGRPDFRYISRVLYADTVTPRRVAVNSPQLLTISGLGFTPNTSVTIGGAAAPIISLQPNQLIVSTPALSESLVDIALTDSSTGLQASITGALTFGAPDGVLSLISGANPQIPVGTRAPNPMRVEVTDASGVPVAGATVTFSAPAGILLSCGISTCNDVTDETGQAQTFLTVNIAGASTISASLANGQLLTTSVNGISAAVDLAFVPATFWVSSGSSGTANMAVVVVSNGVRQSGASVKFYLTVGTAQVGSPTATTDVTGTATSSLTFSNLTSEVDVVACVSPANSPCKRLSVFPVTPGSVHLDKTGGDQQMIVVGQSFAPVSVRVRDSSTPSNPVVGIPVRFRVEAFRVADSTSASSSAETITTTPATPVAVSTSDAVVYSDAYGNASVTPSFAASQGALMVFVTAYAENQSQRFQLQSIWQPASGTSSLAAHGLGTSHDVSPRITASADADLPTRSPSCTKAGCSAASAPNVLRQGSTTSSRAPSAFEDK